MAELCTAISRGFAEPILGSASRARRWLLVEQPGSWGRDALRESALPTVVADHLATLARSLPARVLLIRRVGGQDSASGVDPPTRTVLAGVSHPGGGGWLERFDLGTPEQIIDLDLTGLSTGRSVGGQPVSDPTYLVCTNGKHDACCAVYGLPVARALAGVQAAQTWECSHVGGDRFAGNLVCLPDGIFYGHLDPDSAVRAVTAHASRQLLLDHCRGRSALSFPAQAAELLARERLGIDGIDDLRFVAETRVDDDHHVRFILEDDRQVTAIVHRSYDEVARVTTCGTAPVAPPTYELLDLQVSPADRA